MRENATIPIVSVVLSSYNGESYIKEQIESILCQEEVDIRLVVRDDGSTDNTVQILEKYNEKGLLKLIKGNNVGFRKSFMIALLSCDDADYYAFSDQDDVWKPQKIIRTINKLKNTGIPEMGFANAYLTDPRLNPIKIAYGDDYSPPKKEMCFSSCVASGYLVVFNNSLKQLLDLSGVNIPVSHDIWAGAVATYLGEVHFINEPLAYHRRLSNSVSKRTFITLLSSRINALIHDKGVNILCAKLMLKSFKNQMTEADIKYLDSVVNYRRSIKDKVKLLINPNIYYEAKYGRLTPKIKVLLNRF